MSSDDESKITQEESMSEGLGEMEGVDNPPISYIGEEDNTTLPTEGAAETMEDDEMSHTLNFASGNTNIMYMEDMMNIRYKQFNKALTDLACLVDTFSADKKTVKYIKGEYLKTYMAYFDVVKYIYNLDIADPEIVPGTSADRVLFKREVVEPKRVKLNNGKKLHIYVNKDGKYQFIDELYNNGVGIGLEDLAFWIENRDNFTDNYVQLENAPAIISIFGRAAFIPMKGLRIPRNGNIMAERFYAILGRLHKQIGDMLAERKKSLASKGHVQPELEEEDDDE